MAVPLLYSLIIVKVIELKKSLLVRWKVLRLFVKKLTTDDKFSLLSRDSSNQTIQMRLSQKQKKFPHLFCAVFKSSSSFEHFQKKMTLIAYVFPNLRTPKDVVR